jgi:hypothetical protein
MNRTTTLLSIALMMLLCGGMTFGKAKGSNPPKDDTKKKDQNMLVGTVLKVDGTTITIKTRGKNSGELTITTDSKTEFQFNGKATTLEKIKPGQEAVVTLGTTSTAPATKFSATDETKKKPKKKKKDE